MRRAAFQAAALETKGDLSETLRILVLDIAAVLRPGRPRASNRTGHRRVRFKALSRSFLS